MYLTTFANKEGIYHSKEFKYQKPAINYAVKYCRIKGTKAKVIEGVTTPIGNGLNSTVYTSGKLIFKKSI